MNSETNNEHGTNNEAFGKAQMNEVNVQGREKEANVQAQLIEVNDQVQFNELCDQGQLNVVYVLEQVKAIKETWLPEEANWLLDRYKILEGEIGRNKRFLTKTALCEPLSQEFENFFERKKTPRQISNRIVTIQRQRRNSANSVKSVSVSIPTINELSSQNIVRGPTILRANAAPRPLPTRSFPSSDFVERLIQGWSSNRPSTVGVASAIEKTSCTPSTTGVSPIVGCNGPAIVGLPSAGIRPLSSNRGTAVAGSRIESIRNKQSIIDLTGSNGPENSTVVSVGNEHVGTVQTPVTVSRTSIRTELASVVAVQSASTSNENRGGGPESTIPGPSTGNSDISMHAQSKLLLELYDLYKDQIGGLGIFDDKKTFWQYITGEINLTFNTNKSWEQVERQYKNIIASDGSYDDPVGRNLDRWTNPETTLLLDQYHLYMDEVGPFGVFRTKTALWQYLARKINSQFGVNKSWEQVESKYKTIVRAKKRAVDTNRTSGAARMDVQYQDEIEKITARDDSIEPEVLRGVNFVKYKESSNVKHKDVSKPRWAKPTKKGILNSLSESFLIAEKRKAEREEERERRKNERQKQTLEKICKLLKKD